MTKSNKYKKLQSWYPKPEIQRAAEKQFYDNEPQEMRHKKKSTKTGKLRSDHKHLYIYAEICDVYLGREYSFKGKVCSICGKIRRSDWRKEHRAAMNGEKSDNLQLPKYLKINERFARKI